mmetsp:Transcript_31109/g.97853  ORF Transcript_31109/g.97853 Transcript_31109/m.97853 type:complete len:300 (+) Transcript_31109:360-1259(+)
MPTADGRVSLPPQGRKNAAPPAVVLRRGAPRLLHVRRQAVPPPCQRLPVGDRGGVRGALDVLGPGRGAAEEAPRRALPAPHHVRGLVHGPAAGAGADETWGGGLREGLGGGPGSGLRRPLPLLPAVAVDEVGEPRAARGPELPALGHRPGPHVLLGQPAVGQGRGEAPEAPRRDAEASCEAGLPSQLRQAIQEAGVLQQPGAVAEAMAAEPLPGHPAPRGLLVVPQDGIAPGPQRLPRCGRPLLTAFIEAALQFADQGHNVRASRCFPRRDPPPAVQSRSDALARFERSLDRWICRILP